MENLVVSVEELNGILATTPFLKPYGFNYHWGLKRSKDLEGWGGGICLLDEWSYFDRPEPRLAHVRWMRHFPLFAKATSIYHYRPGETARGGV
jgi:hypothetical protein